MFRALIFLLLLAVALPALGRSRGALVLTPTDTKKPVTLYSKSHALVIGIDEYTGGWNPLRNAVNDAQAVAKELGARGFQVTLKTDLKTFELDQAFRSFLTVQGADPEARLLIWFAGHGYSLPRRFESNVFDGYLIPANAPLPPADTKDFGAIGRFRNSAFELAKIGLYMKQAAAKHVLAVMDSCFSGTVFEYRSAANIATPRITKRTTQPVRQLLSSGTRGQEVRDDGLFRRLFLDAITGREPEADTNKDGWVTGGELGRFLSYRVARYTENQQTPQLGKLKAYGLDRGDFVFRVRGEASATSTAKLCSRRRPSPRRAWPGRWFRSRAVARSFAPSSNSSRVLFGRPWPMQGWQN